MDSPPPGTVIWRGILCLVAKFLNVENKPSSSLERVIIAPLPISILPYISGLRKGTSVEKSVSITIIESGWICFKCDNDVFPVSSSPEKLQTIL